MTQEKHLLQLSAPLRDKLDEPLAQLCNGGLAPRGRVAILVLCDRDAVEAVSQQVSRLGGTARHQLLRIGAIAAWMPLSAVEPLARLASVLRLELEQSFTIA